MLAILNYQSDIKAYETFWCICQLLIIIIMSVFKIDFKHDEDIKSLKHEI